MTTAFEAWAALEPAWRECFDLAWESFARGSVGVGAVVLDPERGIVARGRSRARETDAVAGHLGNAVVAHAEINALGQLRRADGHLKLTRFRGLSQVR